MPGNSFGRVFRITTWGESHGPAIGVVVDGCPAGLEISEEDIQYELDRRRPGQSRLTTQRKEPDKVEILSGVFEGKTLPKEFPGIERFYINTKGVANISLFNIWNLFLKPH